MARWLKLTLIFPSRKMTLHFTSGSSTQREILTFHSVYRAESPHWKQFASLQAENGRGKIYHIMQHTRTAVERCATLCSIREQQWKDMPHYAAQRNSSGKMCYIMQHTRTAAERYATLCSTWEQQWKDMPQVGAHVFVKHVHWLCTPHWNSCSFN